MDDDVPYPTPSPVVAAIALGVAPLPFLVIYAVLFIVHGTLHPVSPPDITGSQSGELIAGLIAAALFVIGVLSLWWFLNRRRRWLFTLGQLATLVTSVDFIVDPTKGSALVPVLLVATSAVAFTISLMPVSARYVDSHLLRRTRPEKRAPA